MAPSMKREDIPELLDDDLGTPVEIEGSMRDLRMINRLFGGITTSEALLWRVARRTKQQTLSVVEVGGAKGESAAELRRRFGTRGVKLDYTIVDINPSHLNGNFPSVAGEALHLPLRSESVDVVICALLAHHLQPMEIEQFAREALRVARRALVINDLRRGYTHMALIYAGMPLFRSRLTRHDSVASVKRAYTPEELRALLERSGRHVEISKHYLFRMGAIVWN
jgi:hypothetical protein